MQPPCSTRGATIAFLPFHSKRSGLLGSEEPETSSIIAPSPKISPALMMQHFVAFDPLFALGIALVFKAVSSCAPAVHERHNRLATAQVRYFPETKNANLHFTRAAVFMRHRNRFPDLRVNGKSPTILAGPELGRHTSADATNHISESVPMSTAWSWVCHTTLEMSPSCPQ
jgi:hypothetical protein